MTRIDLTSSGGKIARSYEKLRDAIATPYDLSTLDPRAYAAEDLALAVRFWRTRMLAEHRSVQVFTQIALQILEANLPLDATTVTLRMAQDELIHTEICGRLLVALGAEAMFDADITVAPLAKHAGVDLQERALRNVLFATCLSEMISVGRLVDSLETTSDPAAHSAIRAILADEVMHGQFGFLLLDAVAPQLDERPQLREGLAKYLTLAFAHLEAELAPKASLVPGAGAVALGVLVPDRAHDVFYGTIHDAIVPGLEARGIAAARAWRDRSLTR